MLINIHETPIKPPTENGLINKHACGSELLEYIIMLLLVRDPLSEMPESCRTHTVTQSLRKQNKLFRHQIMLVPNKSHASLIKILTQVTDVHRLLIGGSV